MRSRLGLISKARGLSAMSGKYSNLSQAHLIPSQNRTTTIFSSAWMTRRWRSSSFVTPRAKSGYPGHPSAQDSLSCSIQATFHRKLKTYLIGLPLIRSPPEAKRLAKYSTAKAELYLQFSGDK